MTVFDKEQARDVFLRYAENYDTQNILISHKIEHTLRVAALSERYAAALGLGAADIALAWFLGLLHDIGPSSRQGASAPLWIPSRWITRS